MLYFLLPPAVRINILIKLIMINDSNLPSLSTYNYTGSAVFIDVLLTVQQVFICYSNVLHKMENSLKP